MGQLKRKILHFTRKGIFQKYETARPNRLRTLRESEGDGNRPVSEAGAKLRKQARHLDENHDLVSGIFDILVNNTIGPKGIAVEAQPRMNNGEIAVDFVEQLMKLHKDWSRAPEVTGEYNRASMERALCRSMYRDGEVFLHHIIGNKRSLLHGSAVPYSLELLESDYVPFEMPADGRDSSNTISGIVKNDWGRPVAYKVYKQHPGAMYSWNAEIKTVKREVMSHLKLTKRIGQNRGVSVLAPVLSRLHDLKDYEESERIAARISAAQCMAVIKGSPDMYVPEVPLPGEEVDEDEYREFDVSPGAVWDDLLPGESVQDISPSRPSLLLQPFRDAMMKAVASGASVSYSSSNKDYSGTFSSQRQELTEQYVNYSTLQGNFVSMASMPMWMMFVNSVIRSGLVKVPRGLDESTLFDAEYRGPVMPWIDPVKEATANVELVRAGFKSQSQVIRERGDDPAAVMAEVIRERQFAEENDLKFTTTLTEVDEGETDEKPDSSEDQGAGTEGAGGKT